MGTIYRLAANTCKECMREPVYYLMLITALVLIGLFPTASMFVFRKQIKLVVDSSLATTMLFSLFASVLCAAHTISREMKNGTVLLLMSKPVTRFSFISAKMIGITVSLTIFVVLCSCACFMALLTAKDQFWLDYVPMCTFYGVIIVSAAYGGFRNYMYQKSFSANAVAGLLYLLPAATVVCYVIRVWNMTHIDTEEFMPAGQLLPALVLLFFAIWTMGAISSALATRLDFVGNLLVCLAIFLVGLVSQYFIRVWFGDAFFGTFLSSLIPNWQYFWMADALTNETHIPISYLAWGFIYMLFTVIIWGAWAVFMFQDNELARDSR